MIGDRVVVYLVGGVEMQAASPDRDPLQSAPNIDRFTRVCGEVRLPGERMALRRARVLGQPGGT
jgi:hypothetical protein